MKTCEDCINRAELIDKTIKRNNIWLKITDSRGMNLQEIIDELPSIQPKTGRWIYDDECHEHGHCSECGYGRIDLVDGEPHNFCRRCGARMITPHESEDKA